MEGRIVVDGVGHRYGARVVLHGLRFGVAPHELVCVVGQSGCGKTTLLRIVAGLSRPSRGAIKLKGSIGVLGHGIGVYDELSALENLTLFGRLHNLPNPRKRADEMLERVGLGRVRDGLAREFSRGMRQRLAVGRAFLHDPEVLLLDEPFTALDDRAIAVLQSMIKDMRDKGRTIVMSTHQLREALELASHVALLQRGQVVHAGERTQQMLDDTGWLYRTYGDN